MRERGGGINSISRGERGAGSEGGKGGRIGK